MDTVINNVWCRHMCIEHDTTSHFSVDIYSTKHTVTRKYLGQFISLPRTTKVKEILLFIHCKSKTKHPLCHQP